MAIETLELLPVGASARAVITGRSGGVSSPPYESLNLGYHDLGGGFDDPADVAANRRLVCDTLGLDRLTVGEQVHATRVAIVDRALAGAGHDSHSDAKERLGRTDAMITNAPGVALTILVADCVPVAFWDPTNRAIGVAHAGRGGTVGGIAGEVVAAMRANFGTSPADLHVAFGPHIGPTHYEVGPAEVEQFSERFSDPSLLHWTDHEAGTASLDLEGALRADLRAVGVVEDRVSSAGIDTWTATASYFSDRRRRPTGRFGLVCWIVPE